MGEFTKNKFDGFGLLIEFNYKYLKYKKVIFIILILFLVLFIFNEKIMKII